MLAVLSRELELFVCVCLFNHWFKQPPKPPVIFDPHSHSLSLQLRGLTTKSSFCSLDFSSVHILCSLPLLLAARVGRMQTDKI